MKTQKIFKLKNISIIILTLVLAVSALGLISVNTVKAESLSTQLVLPKSSLEYQSLINPVDTYSDDDITAVLQKDELLIYQNGSATRIRNTTDTPVYSVKQVKRLNNSNLLMSTKGRLVTVNLNTNKFDELQFSTDINESGDFFDFNSNYFVLSYGELTVYNFNGEQVSNKLASLSINNGTPVSINSKDDVFFLNANHKLCKYTISTKKTLELTDKTLVANPSSIIANSQYLYYLLGDNIYKISVNGGTIIELEKPTSDFDLGKISNPTSISFKGNNLLVTGDDAVQEFKVTEDNKLEFTGFAIAKGKTAYNRISTTVKEIEREKDTVATLDGNKLSLINVSNSFNAYDKTNFTHFTLDKIKNGAKSPDTFALGKNSALFLYDKGNTASSLGIFDFEKQELTAITIANAKSFIDVVYQSGKFYALSRDNTTSKIFVSGQDNVEFKQYASANKTALGFEVDVFGNVFLYDNNNVYSLNASNGTAKSIKTVTGVKKLESDLNGNLFALDSNNQIHSYINGTWQSEPTTLTSTTTSSKAISFAMDFDKKDAFIVYNGEELISKTNALSNLAIDDITLPGTFITTSANATQEFKAYTSINGANVYAVNKTDNGGLKFNELVTDKTDYAFVTEIVKNGLSLYALVGQDDIVLINTKQVVDISPVRETEVPLSAYITTGVNGYYFPIITAKADYALFDSQTVRLQKEQVIYPKHKITFLDKDYYYAEFKVNEKTYKGYVPVDYTIEVLSQDFKWESYTIEKVNKTTVYQEKELSTALKELSEGEGVRVLSIEGDIAHVAFSTQDGFVTGYIKASSIQNAPQKAITNLLIIIAVLASVCGTTTFFLLRKKK